MSAEKIKSKLKMFDTIGLDTMVFIYHLGKTPPYLPLTLEIFKQLEGGKISAFTSIVSYIESLAHPPLEKTPEKVENFRQFFINVPNLFIRVIDFEVGDLAAQYCRTYKLRLPDALQLATAVISRCDVFVTNDARFRKVKEIPILLLSDFVSSKFRKKR